MLLVLDASYAYSKTWPCAWCICIEIKEKKGINNILAIDVFLYMGTWLYIMEYFHIQEIDSIHNMNLEKQQNS